LLPSGRQYDSSPTLCTSPRCSHRNWLRWQEEGSGCSRCSCTRSRRSSPSWSSPCWWREDERKQDGSGRNVTDGSDGRNTGLRREEMRRQAEEKRRTTSGHETSI
ncbi:hypothetical protein PMAYCL1PPCAC_28956, partial [Pristionchus mayeri]